MNNGNLNNIPNNMNNGNLNNTKAQLNIFMNVLYCYNQKLQATKGQNVSKQQVLAMMSDITNSLQQIVYSQ